MRNSPEIVYVLSGGAAKGICHLGMIEALEREGIRPDFIVGSSAGAVIGALYSYFGDVRGVVERMKEVFSSDAFESFEKKYLGIRLPLDGHAQKGVKGFFSGLSESLKSTVHIGMSLITSAMIAEKDMAAIFAGLFKDITFESLKIPFAAVAVDLADGVSVTFTAKGGRAQDSPLTTHAQSDALMKAVMASSAIPLIFPAVRIDGRSFVDGGIMANLPVREAEAIFRGRQALLVGFDVSAPVTKVDEELSSIELALRLLDLATRSAQAAERELVDVLFRPLEKDYLWSAFTEFQKFIEIGRHYMTPDRVAAFQDKYREKCVAGVSHEPNVLKRFFSRAKVKQIAS